MTSSTHPISAANALGSIGDPASHWGSMSMAFLLVAVAAYVIASFAPSARLKGAWGEKVVGWGLRQLDPREYTTVHDVYLPHPRNHDRTSQIDHIVISRFGVFVIETKNMNGAIWGRTDDRQWTQTFGRNRKHRFQNPLLQNRTHARAVARFLDIPDVTVHSIVVFIGHAKLMKRSELPPNVLTGNPNRYITRFTAPILGGAEVARCTHALRTLDQTLDRSTARANHLAALKRRRRPSRGAPVTAA